MTHSSENTMTVTVIIVLFQQTYLLRPSHYLRHIQPFEPHIRVTVARCIYQPSRFCHTDRPPVPLRSDLLPVVLSSSNLVLPQEPWHTDKQHFVGTTTEVDRIVGEEVIVPFSIDAYISRLLSCRLYQARSYNSSRMR